MHELLSKVFCGQVLRLILHVTVISGIPKLLELRRGYVVAAMNAFEFLLVYLCQSLSACLESLRVRL
jgi:hypothetical protein